MRQSSADIVLELVPQHIALIAAALNLHEAGLAQRREPESPPLATSMRSVLRERVLE
jgi:hypothetical protein